jgi:hypothetical protein
MGEVRLSETELKVFTYVTQHNYKISLSEASSTLHLSTEELQRALDSLADKGVIGKKSSKEGGTPDVLIEATEEQSSKSKPIVVIRTGSVRDVKPGLVLGTVVGAVVGLVVFTVIFILLALGGMAGLPAGLCAFLVAAVIGTAIAYAVARSVRK